MSKEPWSHVLQLAFLVQVDELKFSLVSVWLFFVFFNLSLVQIFCFVISHETAWDQEPALTCSQCFSFTCQKNSKSQK